MSYEIWELTPEQKAIVTANYEKLTINELIPLTFGPQAKPDSRTTEGRSIKAYLAGENKKAIPTDTPPIGEIILTDDQKLQIEEMAPRVRKDGGALELARIVFGNPRLTALHKESRAVFAYMREVYPEGININDEPVEDTSWQPPSTMGSLIGLVNDFVLQADSSKTYNLATLKPSERRCLEQLMKYIRVYGFKYYASVWEKKVDRDLYLSTFIRWAYTKPDLTDIEIDQTIAAAVETVYIAQMGREIEDVRRYHEAIRRKEVTNEHGKTVAYGMAQVEEINGLRSKHDTYKRRLESLMDSLETARSKRKEDSQGKFASVLDLVKIWEKDEVQRTKWIETGEAEKAEDVTEVERLSGLEDLIALISGQTKDEASR